MKRSVWIAMILLVFGLLCGCVHDPSASPSEPPRTTETSPAASLPSETAATDGAENRLPTATAPLPETEPSETEPSETEPSETEPSETEPPETEPSGTEAPATADTGTGSTEPTATTETAQEYQQLAIADVLAQPASIYAAHVFSHQGTEREEDPETFAAYDLAILYGSRYLEQDLVISSDGVLYCSHELSPEKLTGETRLFSEMTSGEIDALRTVTTGQRLLRLQDVFDRYGTAVTYVIELKAGEPVIEPFLELVREYGMEEHIIVQSSSLWFLQKIEEVFPDMQKLFLLFDKEKFDAALEAEYVDIVAGGSIFFNQSSCQRTHEAGKKFCLYVCNSTKDIRSAIEIGADCYFTDYTGKALALEAIFRN